MKLLGIVITIVVCLSLLLGGCVIQTPRLPAIETAPQTAPSPQVTEATVVRVIDGDTIEVDIGGRLYRELSMLALYDEARYEETDEAILAKHPFVKMWEEATPYVFKFNPAYKSLFDMLT